jgi:hypothetical protein
MNARINFIIRGLCEIPKSGFNRFNQLQKRWEEGDAVSGIQQLPWLKQLCLPLRSHVVYNNAEYGGQQER